MFAPLARRMLARFETAVASAPIDVVGAALLIVFVGALQLMLDLGKDHDWFAAPGICALAVIAAIGVLACTIWELNEKHPMVDLRVFRHHSFGYTSTWAGPTAWSGVLAVVAAPIAGLLIAKTDARRLIFFGLRWLAGVNMLCAVAATEMSYWQTAVPLIALSLGSVEPDETASGAGLQSFLRPLSRPVASSVVTTVWEDHARVKHEELVGVLDGGGDAAVSLAASGLTPDVVRSMLDHLLEGQSVMLATN